MAIYHAGETFTGLAGPFHPGQVTAPLQVNAYAGLAGVSVIADARKERVITCGYIIDGQVSLAALRLTLDYIARLTNSLYGTLSRDDNAAESQPNCLFLGFTPSGPPRYSPGGTVGWFVKGQLAWLQTYF